MMVNNIYLDYAATTYVKKEVFDEMLPYFSEEFGNASSVYTLARTARKAVEVARKQVADAIGATPGEIYFTSGGTEADNWAIKGLMERKGKGSGHIITSSIEHHAVLHTCQTLEKKGYDVTYLPVDENGLVSPQSVKDALRDDTLLVTIMFANNEIGTIEPIEEIGAICRAHRVAFHTDAVQAIGNVEIDVAAAANSASVINADLKFDPQMDYTIAAVNSLSNIEPIVLIDDNTPPTAGNVKVRLIHAAQSAGLVDIYITAPGDDISTLSPTVSNFDFKDNSGYLEVPAGNYRVRITLATTKTVAIDTGTLALADGQIRTAFAVDPAPGSTDFGVILLADLN